MAPVASEIGRSGILSLRGRSPLGMRQHQPAGGRLAIYGKPNVCWLGGCLRPKYRPVAWKPGTLTHCRLGQKAAVGPSRW